MSPEENKATLLQLLKELDKGNLAINDEGCSPNFHFQSPNFPRWPRGLEGARALAAAGRTMFTELKATMEDIFGGRRQGSSAMDESRHVYRTIQDGLSKSWRAPRDGYHRYLPFCRWKNRRGLGSPGVLNN